MNQAMIELDEVSLGWRDRVALRDVSGRFVQGSLTAIVGPNGAGKSTLVKALMGQLSPLSGEIRFAPDAQNNVACLPQLGELDRSFPISVYDLVAMGGVATYWVVEGFFGLSEHDRVLQALDTVGLADFSRRIIGTLSGGQLQRALFARLMLHNASVLILDEPFAAVDRHTTDDLLELLLIWHNEGRTVIVVLHDLDCVRNLFPETLLLAGQVVGWGQTAQVLTTENLHLARHLCAGDYL